MATRFLLIATICVSMANNFAFANANATLSHEAVHTLQQKSTAGHSLYDIDGRPLWKYQLYVSTTIDGKPAMAKVRLEFPPSQRKSFLAAMVQLINGDTPSTISLVESQGRSNALFFAIPPNLVEAFESQNHVQTKMIKYDPERDLIVTPEIFDSSNGQNLKAHLGDIIQVDRNNTFALLTNGMSDVNRSSMPQISFSQRGASIVVNPNTTLKPLSPHDQHPFRMGDSGTFSVEEISGGSNTEIPNRSLGSN